MRRRKTKHWLFESRTRIFNQIHTRMFKGAQGQEEFKACHEQAAAAEWNLDAQEGLLIESNIELTKLTEEATDGIFREKCPGCDGPLYVWNRLAGLRIRDELPKLPLDLRHGQD